MTKTCPTGRPIESLGELLAHALRIEEEAEERYLVLADQMETHNNPELAKLFRDFAGHEKKHGQSIRRMMANLPVPDLKPWEFKWGGPESPEMVDIGQIHYRMTPWHALQLALAAEQNAFAFFDRIAECNADPELKRWAREFATEEDEHVKLVLRELAKYPRPEGNWDDDPDPPTVQE